MDPSSGNIRPSWAVTKAPVTRKVRNARIQYGNMAGPANWTPAELLMNRTMATKMTTKSNGPSVLDTRTGASCSETMARSGSRVACISHPSLPTRGRALVGQGDAPSSPSDRGEFSPRPARKSSVAALGPQPVQAAAVLRQDAPPQALRLLDGQEVPVHRLRQRPLERPPAQPGGDPDHFGLGGLVRGVQQLAGGGRPQQGGQ